MKWNDFGLIRETYENRLSGCEAFPGEMLRPNSENIILTKSMLDLMVEYYNATYESHDFKVPFDHGPEDSIIIGRVTINM